MIARSSFTVASALAWMLAFGASGCGRSEARSIQLGVADAAGDRAVLGSMDAQGRSVFARRIDGNITDVFRADVFGEGDEFVVLTGYGGGEDQGKVMVFGLDGILRAERRVEGRTPFPAPLLRARTPGELERQLQRPLPGHFRTFEHGGRRFLAVATGGWWAPHAVEVWEVLPGVRDAQKTLHPQVVIWNRGSFSHMAIRDGQLAFLGLNNSFPPANGAPYGIGVGLVDLRPHLKVLEPSSPAVIQFPTRDAAGNEDPGVGYSWYVLLPEGHGIGNSEILPLEFAPDFVRVPMERGVEYRLRHADGNPTVVLDQDGISIGDPPGRATLQGPSMVDDLRRRTRVFQRK